MNTPRFIVAVILFFVFFPAAQAVQGTRVLNGVPHKSYEMVDGDWVSKISIKLTGKMSNYHYFRVMSSDGDKTYTTEEEFGSLPIGTVVWVPVSMLIQDASVSTVASAASAPVPDDKQVSEKPKEHGSGAVAESNRDDGQEIPLTKDTEEETKVGDTSLGTVAKFKGWAARVYGAVVGAWNFYVYEFFSLNGADQVYCLVTFVTVAGSIIVVYILATNTWIFAYIVGLGVNTKGFHSTEARPKPNPIKHDVVHDPAEIRILSRLPQETDNNRSVPVHMVDKRLPWTS